MSEPTSATISIAAPARTVLRVIADFADYPAWASGVTAATVLSEDGDGWADEVELTLNSGVVKDTLVLNYGWDVTDNGTGVVSWRLVSAGMLTQFDGSYTLGYHDVVTQLSYRLTLDLSLPLSAQVKRTAERRLVATSLEQLRARAESLG